MADRILVRNHAFDLTPTDCLVLQHLVVLGTVGEISSVPSTSLLHTGRLVCHITTLLHHLVLQDKYAD